MNGFCNKLPAGDYMALRRVRLRSGAEWVLEGAGVLFVLVHGGDGKLATGATERHLEPGDLLVVSRGNGARLVGEGLVEWVFDCFSVCLEHLFPLFDASEVSLLRRVGDGFGELKLYRACEAPAREAHRLLAEVSQEGGIEHRSALLRIVAGTLAVGFKERRQQQAGFVRIQEHMVQVFEQLSIADILTSPVMGLAGRFGCSRRHLNRLFHQHFGLSVAGLKMELRLLKAMSLLRSSDAKVTHVAEECGFNHLGLFNACFKRRFGASPGRWRKGIGHSEGRSLGMVNGSEACPLRSNGLCPWGAPAKPAAARNSEARIPLAASGCGNRREPRGAVRWLGEVVAGVG